MSLEPAPTTTPSSAAHRSSAGSRSVALLPLRAALAVVCLALLVLALAPVAAAQSVDDQVHRIAKGIRCPICQGLSVADSPTELAREMRGIIRDKLERGESNEAIVHYFVERYGDEVLMAPPAVGMGLVAWLVPGVALLVGLSIVGFALRGWLRRGSVAPEDNGSLHEDEDTAADDPELRRALERWQRGSL